MDLLLTTGEFVLGVAMLVYGAYLLVEGGTRVAGVLGISPVVIGLTVVAFGTSAPEFFVSAVGALNGNTELVLGNVIGSNVANIGLILALTAMVRPVVVEKQLSRQEVPFLMFVTLLFILLAWDEKLTRLDGGILAFFFIAFMVSTIRSGARGKAVVLVQTPQPLEDQGHRARQLSRGSIIAVLGMIGLAGGGHFIVDSATALARIMGVGDAVIGLTLVAVGTSLPELATSIMAAWKGHDDMALGNIIGSNLFNLLGVAGPIAFARELDSNQSIDPQLLAMGILTLLVALMVLPRDLRIGRRQGALLLLLYIVCNVSWLK